jgi:hypothetical protein
LLNLFGSYEPCKTIPKAVGNREQSLMCQPADDVGSDLQQGCRFLETEEAFRRHGNAGRRHWAVSTEIIGAEQVTSDPSKPFCAAGRCQTIIDNGLYDSSKVGTMAEVILHRVAQRYELARFGVFRTGTDAFRMPP